MFSLEGFLNVRTFMSKQFVLSLSELAIDCHTYPQPLQRWRIWSGGGCCLHPGCMKCLKVWKKHTSGKAKDSGGMGCMWFSKLNWTFSRWCLRKCKSSVLRNKRGKHIRLTVSCDTNFFLNTTVDWTGVSCTWGSSFIVGVHPSC